MSCKIAFKNDVAEALSCTEQTALLCMKRTGRAFKVGKKIAIPMCVLENMTNGQFNRLNAETPEQHMRAAAIEIR